MKLPKGLKLYCVRHGSVLKYHDGEYYCMDKFDSCMCTSIKVTSKGITKYRESENK